MDKRSKVRAGSALALAILASCCGLPSSAVSGPLCSIPSAHRYARALRWYMADLKSSFPESGDYTADSALTEANYAAVLSGLVDNVGVNGIRVPMIPDYESSGAYPELYSRIIAAARGLGLAVYASPLSFGPEQYEGWSDARYAAWIANYVAAFRPDFVSPFNEAGFTDYRMRGIVRALRYALARPTVLVGPDKKLVASNIAELEAPYSVAPLFDVIGAHNTGGDTTATPENWARLIADAPGGKPVWSTENPAYWSVGQRAGLPGLIGAVASGVKGLVIWKGKPSLVDDAGQPTAKACKLAQHIVAPL
ncbi:hypothetical protein [Lichenibacterium dinghuense]|uniref:hypothetical protein n=1 Tax=Lichenibacterium dinghuense TaxID=2895977 RepID=UPI001F2FB1C9|nr:hypothetical protein [Lichenibacterium sp. 6Y81]